MAVEVQWYVKGYVVHQLYSEVMSLDDFRHASNATAKMIQGESSENLYFVLDFTPVKQITASITRVSYPSELSLSDEGMGWAVIVCPNQSPIRHHVEILRQVLKYMFNYRFHVSDTVEAALVFLAEQDPTLEQFVKS